MYKHKKTSIVEVVRWPSERAFAQLGRPRSGDSPDGVDVDTPTAVLQPDAPDAERRERPAADLDDRGVGDLLGDALVAGHEDGPDLDAVDRGGLERREVEPPVGLPDVEQGVLVVRVGRLEALTAHLGRRGSGLLPHDAHGTAGDGADAASEATAGHAGHRRSPSVVPATVWLNMITL